jgi:predicted enzyme related to lactoylglutathione lyase
MRSIVSIPAGAVRLYVERPKEGRMATFTRDISSGFELDAAHDIRNVHGAPGWTELSTPDPEGAQEFLAAVFGWTFETMAMDGADYSVASVQGHGVGGVRAPQPHEDGTPAWHTYVAVADAGGLARSVEAAGGSLLMEPFDLPGVGRMVAFSHPSAGVMLALEYLQPFS